MAFDPSSLPNALAPETYDKVMTEMLPPKDKSVWMVFDSSALPNALAPEIYNKVMTCVRCAHHASSEDATAHLA